DVRRFFSYGVSDEWNNRPYSKDTGYEDLDVSALLSVRCLPGYPYKCPKLQITPEKGLSKADADNLLSLLHDQANSNSREGRVMIYNLVEAAQEFLSEIVPLGHSHESVRSANHQFGAMICPSMCIDIITVPVFLQIFPWEYAFFDKYYKNC
ncbi:hypothetical protein RJ639_019446, partial [Escallonia herrerae]